MLNLYYVGFNAYQQCPNDGKTVLPKVIYKWTEFCLKAANDVACTFRNVVIKTESNFIIFGLVNEDSDVNYRTINFPVYPQAFLATDDFLFVTENNKVWKSHFDDKWSEVILSHNNNEELLNWSNKQIVKLCYIHNKPQMIILLNDGSVWRLDADDKLSVVFSPTLDKAVDISCGFEHVVILTASGCVMTFGNGSHGQLGHGDLDPLSEPLQVLGLGGLKVTKIAAAGWHSSAVTDSGDLYMWGWNNFGQLTEIKDCLNTESDQYEMTPLPMLVDLDENKEMTVVDIACGVRHTAIITESNEILSTGWNEYGQLGIDDSSIKKTNRFKDVKLSIGKGQKKLRCGPWSTLIMEENQVHNES